MTQPEYSKDGKEIFEWRRCIEKECGFRKFFITVEEKQYFEGKQFTLPKRCYPCRVRRRSADGSHGHQE